MTSAMKAVTYQRYGSPDVLEFREVDVPVVRDDGVLVRVRAASVNPLDFHFMRGTPYLVRTQTGLKAPKSEVLGADLAGTVEAVGSDVTHFRPGDEVFAEGSGSFAEYACVKEDRLAFKPRGLSFVEAAAVPVAGLTALQGLRDKGRIRDGHNVLINGASGGVGTFAVQIARSLGAEVTGVCSTPNVDLVASLGAHDVIDYTRVDYTTMPRRYDLVLDMIGSRGLAFNRRIMKPSGTYVMVGADMGDWIGPITSVLKVMLASVFGSQTMRPLLAKANSKDLNMLGALIEGGEVAPVIDSVFPLVEARDAIRYVETGRARGKVVLTV